MFVVCGRCSLIFNTGMPRTDAAQVKILAHPDFDRFLKIGRNTVISILSQQFWDCYPTLFLVKMPKCVCSYLVEKSTLMKRDLQIFIICRLNYIKLSVNGKDTFWQLSHFSSLQATKLLNKFERFPAPIIVTEL